MALTRLPFPATTPDASGTISTFRRAAATSKLMLAARRLRNRPSAYATSKKVVLHTSDSTTLYRRSRAIKRCARHLDALYIFALLQTGGCDAARDAVTFAVVAVIDDPAILDATPSQLWAALAETVQTYPRDWFDTGGPASAALRAANLSNMQRAIMALIGSSRTPTSVAALLGTGLGNTKRSFRTGVRTLGAALRALESIDGPSSRAVGTDQAGGECRGSNWSPRPATMATEIKPAPPDRHLRLVRSTPTESRR